MRTGEESIRKCEEHSRYLLSVVTIHTIAGRPLTQFLLFNLKLEGILGRSGVIVVIIIINNFFVLNLRCDISREQHIPKNARVVTMVTTSRFV
jgi:hypothetical protein